MYFNISVFTSLGAPDNSVESEKRGQNRDTHQDDSNTEPTQETNREPGQETDRDFNQEWQQDRAPPTPHDGPNNDIQNSGGSSFDRTGGGNLFHQLEQDPSLEPHK